MIEKLLSKIEALLKTGINKVTKLAKPLDVVLDPIRVFTIDLLKLGEKYPIIALVLFIV